jgi:hypothetical protein
MYCRNCYTNLAEAADTGLCPKCHRKFELGNAKTFLLRPFPSKSKIIVHVLLTTIVGILAAFVVAFFQLVGASGH